MVVHFLRQHWAQPGVTITESKLLYDSHAGIEREVDVVVEGTFDGDPVVTSIEVIEHGRPGSITWVEQQIAKHRYLPTNRLVLISKSGFTAKALKIVGLEGGWVEAVAPNVVEIDGEPAISKLYIDEVNLKPSGGRLHFLARDLGSVEDQVQFNGQIRDVHGIERGTADQLVAEVLHIDWLVEYLLRKSHSHPDRENIYGFSCGVSLAGLEYSVLDEATGERWEILGIDIEGGFEFSQQELSFSISSIANRRFAAAEGDILGRPTVWVHTEDSESGTGKISWRTRDGQPLFDRSSVPSSSPRFPELADLDRPKEWVLDETVVEELGGS